MLRDGRDGAAYVADYQRRYAAFRGPGDASAVIAQASIDRAWPASSVTGSLADGYQGIRASALASSILAVTHEQTGVSLDALTRSYRDIRASAFESALLADVGARNGIDATQLNTELQSLADERDLDYRGAALIVAAHHDTGASSDQLLADFRTIDEATRLGQRGSALLAGASHLAGVPVDVAIERTLQMDPVLVSGNEDTAVIVAAQLLAESGHAADPATIPTWTYALERPDDD